MPIRFAVSYFRVFVFLYLEINFVSFVPLG
jgi:hypothetical protein